MKTALSLGLALTMGTFGLLSLSSNVYAVNANNAGTACKNYNAREVTDIDYLPNGTRNLNASARYVICPIVRSPTSSSYAVNVYVDGFAAAGQTISCTLYSYDYNGTYLGSQSFPTARTGTFDQYLSVPGHYWGTASVLCLLPGSGNGIVYDVDVVQ
jgi:hypothetical protein